MLCYAKSLQSCPTLCDPIDGSLPGSPVPGILQARVLEWSAIVFSEDINYITIKMGNKPSFPLNTLLGYLLVHWEGYQLEGLKKEKKKLSNTVLDTGLLTPGEEGENGPSRGHLDSTPFYSSVYTANERVNRSRFSMSRPLWSSNQDSEKRENISLKTLINGLSKFFWQALKQEIPLTFY